MNEPPRNALPAHPVAAGPAPGTPAAAILAAMDIEVTLAILREMKESQAAKVLMAMDAGMAARISTRLSRQGGA